MESVLDCMKNSYFRKKIRDEPISFISTIIICCIVCIIFISCSPSVITTPTTSTKATIVSPSPSFEPPTREWNSILKQPAPSCNNPTGVLWQILPGTAHICSGRGLVMQQTTNHSYAEMDLDKVSGKIYDQKVFLVQISASFQKPDDTMTSAALLVQTPQAPGVAGGYIFTLTSTGHWQLQRVDTGTSIPTVKSGNVSLNLGDPIKIAIAVQQGRIYGAINNQWLVSYSDTLNPSPGAISLLVERSGGLSSSVIYSNFELDQ